ncbi:sulfatase [Verrucomicrobiaceae bacterium 227]
MKFSIPVALFTTILAHGSTRPNIVLIIADDCTFRDLGCYGGQAHTPHLDKLASQGMRFERCFQSAPMCSPTRHNIFTGLYPVTSGAYPNHTRVDPGTPSIVQFLKPLGYRVAQSGKTHVSPASVFSWEKIPGGKNPEFDKVESFVKEVAKNEAPFCLLLCSNEPHTPWNLGDPSRYPVNQIKLPPYLLDTPETRSGMSRYLAEITYFDDQVGQAMKIIDDQGLTDNTLFLVVSEQGNSLPFAKWTCYDNGLQSGFIARWPGKIKARTTNPAMVEYLDLLPTFIEVAGGTPPASLQGRSLLPVFAGRKIHKEFVYSIMTTKGINNGSDHFGIRAIRSEKFKYIWNLTPEVEFRNVCMTAPEFVSWEKQAQAGDKKAKALVQRYKIRPPVELYDVVNDPLELKNLADDPKYRNVRIDLKKRLTAWMEACHDAGQETELRALERMPGRGKKKSRK